MVKDICDALGIKEPVTDLEVFKFKPARLLIGIESAKDPAYEDSNGIKRVRSLTSDEKPTPSAPKPNSPRPLDSSATNPAPWRRGAA
jgi:hypothetical protein